MIGDPKRELGKSELKNEDESCVTVPDDNIWLIREGKLFRISLLLKRGP